MTHGFPVQSILNTHKNDHKLLYLTNKSNRFHKAGHNLLRNVPHMDQSSATYIAAVVPTTTKSSKYGAAI